MELTTLIEIVLLATAVAGFALMAIVQFWGGWVSTRNRGTGRKLG